MQTLQDLKLTSGPAIVIGSAPSAVNFDYRNFKGIRIGVGDMPWRAREFGPYDYWVTANNLFPLPWRRAHARAIRRAPINNLLLATAAFGGQTPEGARMCHEAMTRDRALVPTILFDQRHFQGHLCEPVDGCCEIFVKSAIGETIQEQLVRRSPCANTTYDGSHSVAFHAIALAIMLGATPIYVAGVEFPLDRKDYGYYRPWKIPPTGSLPKTVQYVVARLKDRLLDRLQRNSSVYTDHGDSLLRDLESLAQAASETDQEIINTSSTSLLTQARGIQTRAWLSFQ